MLKHIFSICIALLVYHEVTGDVEESTEVLQNLIKCVTNHAKELSEKCVPKHEELGKTWLTTANEAKIPVPCVVSDYVLKQKLENCTAETTEKPNNILLEELINATLKILENDEFSKTKAEEYIKSKCDEKDKEKSVTHFNKCLDVYPTEEGFQSCMPYYKGLECTDLILNHDAVVCALQKCKEYKD